MSSSMKHPTYVTPEDGDGGNVGVGTGAGVLVRCIHTEIWGGRCGLGMRIHGMQSSDFQTLLRDHSQGRSTAALCFSSLCLCIS